MAADRPVKEASEAAWLKVLLASALLLLFFVLYFVVQSGGFSERLRMLLLDLLPNLATGLVAFIAIFGVLNRLRDRSEEAITAVVTRAMAADSTGRTFPNDIGDAAHFISELVKSRPPKAAVKIDILAYTGATFCTAVLRDLFVANQERPIEVAMHVVDTEKMTTYYPSHWAGEIADTIRRIAELAFPCQTVMVEGYGFHPFLLGLCIDDEHLFIAFPSWDKLTGKIADQALTYRHHKRSEATDYLFDLYWSWALQPGQRELLSRRTGTRGIGHNESTRS